MITVKELISELKKHDQNSIVGFRDHDADEFMISSWPKGVQTIDFDAIPKERKDENLWNLEGQIVSIYG